MNPSGGSAKGERSICNWDEDAVTMAIEASRDCLMGIERRTVDAIYLASSTLPFAERQCSGIVAAALNLSESVTAADITTSQRAGTTALLHALAACEAGFVERGLVAASDKRHAKAASPQEMRCGDGAAALLVGKSDVIARYIASASSTSDFVDHFRGERAQYDYAWEERWIRDEGYAKLVPSVVKQLLAKSAIHPSEISYFIVPCAFSGLATAIARGLGIPLGAVADDLQLACGDTGVPHPFLMMVNALERAKSGDKIVVVGFGQGCDAIAFEATDLLSQSSARRGVSGSLRDRREELNYMRYLTINDLISWDKGMRAERDNKTALTTLYLKRDMILGLMGGSCAKCGTRQFPRSRICVNPDCLAVDSQATYEFSDVPAKILTWSADYLVFSMDPPHHYGTIAFEGGGRFMADFTDCEAGKVQTGMDVRLVFRIKDFDDRRGFRRYFWKAAPIQSGAA
jgi:3-hydroxy-3-methylglutaryl CoA synthase